MKPYPNVRALERSHGVTWQELTELEPRLSQLLWQARHVSVTCRRWSDVGRLFAPIRGVLVELVGFSATNCRHSVLGCPAAYEVAYWKLYDAVAGLLPCRNAEAETGLEKRYTTTTVADVPVYSDATPVTAA